MCSWSTRSCTRLWTSWTSKSKFRTSVRFSKMTLKRTLRVLYPSTNSLQRWATNWTISHLLYKRRTAPFSGSPCIAHRSGSSIVHSSCWDNFSKIYTSWSDPEQGLCLMAPYSIWKSSPRLTSIKSTNTCSNQAWKSKCRARNLASLSQGNLVTAI